MVATAQWNRCRRWRNGVTWAISMRIARALNQNEMDRSNQSGPRCVRYHILGRWPFEFPRYPPPHCDLEARLTAASDKNKEFLALNWPLEWSVLHLTARAVTSVLMGTAGYLMTHLIRQCKYIGKLFVVHEMPKNVHSNVLEVIQQLWGVTSSRIIKTWISCKMYNSCKWCSDSVNE